MTPIARRSKKKPRRLHHKKVSLYLVVSTSFWNRFLAAFSSQAKRKDGPSSCFLSVKSHPSEGTFAGFLAESREALSPLLLSDPARRLTPTLLRMEDFEK